MYLKECLNSELACKCHKLINKANNYTLEFGTTLDEVALIEISDNNTIELTNERESYEIDYYDAVAGHWSME